MRPASTCRRRCARPARDTRPPLRPARRQRVLASRRKTSKRARPRPPAPAVQPDRWTKGSASVTCDLDYLLLHHSELLSTCVELLSPASVTRGAASASSRLPCTVTIVLLWSVDWPSLYLVPWIACFA